MEREKLSFLAPIIILFAVIGMLFIGTWLAALIL